MDICIVQETRLNGHIRLPLERNFTLFNSGLVSGTMYGVGIVIRNSFLSKIESISYISDRLITMKISCFPCPMFIVGCYAPVDDTTSYDHDFWQQFEELVASCPPGWTLMCCGDFNSRLPRSTPSSTSIRAKSIGQYALSRSPPGPNARRLEEILLTNSLTALNTRFAKKKHHRITFRSKTGRFYSQIDYILVRVKDRSLCSDCRAYWGTSYDSDHGLVSATISNYRAANRRNTTLPRPLPRPRFVLSDEKRAKEFAQALDEELRRKEIPSDPSQLWTDLMESVKSAIDKMKTSNVPYKEYISQGTFQLIEECRQARLRNPKGPETRWLTNRMKAALRTDKVAYYDTLSKELELSAKRHDLKSVYELVNRITKRKGGKCAALAPDLFNQFSRQCYRAPPDQRSPPPLLPTDRPPPPSLEEIPDLLAGLKRHKAPGWDLIPADWLKTPSTLVPKWLHALVDTFWQTLQVPNAFRLALVVPLAKKQPTTIASNCRPISLLCHGYKLLERSVIGKLKEHLIPRLRPNQCAFRPAMATTDCLSSLRLITETRREFQRPFVLIFYDIKSAFDQIPVHFIVEALQFHDTPPHLISLVLSLLRDQCSVVTNHGAVSEPYETDSLRQGSLLSPLLFITTLDVVMRRVQERVGTLLHTTENVYSSHFLTDREFADDILGVAGDSQIAQVFTDSLNSELNAVGLKLNISKCAVMKFGDAGDFPIQINGESIVEVEEFVYLGSVFSVSPQLTREVETRKAKAGYMFFRLKRVLLNPSIPTLTRLRIYGATVRAVLLYAAGTWAPRKEDLRSLEVFDKRLIRKIVRGYQSVIQNGETIWINISDKELWKRAASLRPLGQIILNLRWSWFGHVMRRGEDHPVRSVVSSITKDTPETVRKQGGQTLTYPRRLIKDMQEAGKSTPGFLSLCAMVAGMAKSRFCESFAEMFS